MAASDQEVLGWRCLEEGRLEEAEGHFRRCLELDPDRVDALNGLGSVYLAWDELDEAAELFQMAIAMAETALPRQKRQTGWKDPQVRPYVKALHSLAMTRLRRQAFDEALAPLEEVVAWDPSGLEGEAFLLLGYCRHRAGDLKGALDCYGKARAKHPAAWYLKGLSAFLLGQMFEAQKSFRAGLQLMPEIGPLIAYYPRVRGLPGQGNLDYQEAVGFVESTIELWTPDAQALLRQVLTMEAVSSL